MVCLWGICTMTDSLDDWYTDDYFDPAVIERKMMNSRPMMPAADLIKSKRQRKWAASAVPLGEEIQCANCAKPVVKRRRNQAFCGDSCRTQYSNLVR